MYNYLINGQVLVTETEYSADELKEIEAQVKDGRPLGDFGEVAKYDATHPIHPDYVKEA
jgi:hypothetical protein